jgi:mannosylglycerate hydrolase
LPRQATVSHAECAFAVVERGLQAEGGPSERGLPTYPSRRFVSAGGLTVVHEGLLEYELVDGGRTLALTLLRATGMLSRVDVAYRPLPAGPPIPVEGPQMAGLHRVSYALHTGGDDPYAVADDVFLPLLVAAAPGGGHRPSEGTALEVTGAEVSAVRRVAGLLEIRVFNPTTEETHVGLPGRRGELVDLRGRPLESFEDGFALRPWGIATARLAETS